MIYQLAKTSPLITGQVKMNFVLNGNKVVDLQYVPLSNYIKFNYSNPDDVLNYSHCENIAKLYNKISGVFYSPIHKPSIDEHSLHRYSVLKDDTHENTYEMGMKRLEYKRYNKQFEFFTPVWCDTKQELENIVFEICFKNPNSTHLLYSKIIEFNDKIKSYLDSCWVNKQDIDQDLVYIDFKKYQSYIKGINAKKGLVQVCDTSTVLNTLLERERPVLEVDNIIANLFRENKIIASQIYNFSFAFDIEDILPPQMLEQFNCERINVYINIYEKYIEKVTKNSEDTKESYEVNVKKYRKVEVKDLYSNYDFIPKYNINTGKYDNKYNVLDYMDDYKCIDLIDKNKLVQSTFHWTLRDNQDSIFNLYNGFAPIFKYGNNAFQSSRISCNEPDVFTDLFDPLKNPFGVFKYIDMSENILDTTQFETISRDDKNFFHLRIDSDSKEFVNFGNLFVETKKIPDNMKDIDFYFNIIHVSDFISLSNIEGVLSGDVFNVSPNLLYRILPKQPTGDQKSSEYRLTLYVKGFNKGDYNKFLFPNGLLNLYIKNEPEDLSNIKYIFKNLANAIVKPNIITLEGSVSKNIAKSPSIQTDEVVYNKTEQNIVLYRYTSNLLPKFIDTNIDKDNDYWENYDWKNNTYWTKQYDKDIVEYVIDESKDLEIYDFVKYQQSKFIPTFKSINYFAIKGNDTDYNKYYLIGDKLQHELQQNLKEISWYKNNSLFCLPKVIYYSDIKPTGYEFSHAELLKIVKDELTKNGNDIFVLQDEEKNNALAEYIFNLYSYSFKTEYESINNIKEQKIEIKFTLK